MRNSVIRLWGLGLEIVVGNGGPKKNMETTLHVHICNGGLKARGMKKKMGTTALLETIERLL